MIIPAYPAFNIYSRAARKTTALGPVCVATAVGELGGWDVEVIDENNLRRYGPKGEAGGADHAFLQQARPADIAGFYGGLTSTIPRLYRIARFYKEQGAVTVAGGHHFTAETIPEALGSGIDYAVIGEGEEAIQELLRAFEKGSEVSGIRGIAYRDQGRVIFTPPREPIADFDRLPMPNFSLVRYAKIKTYPVERIRGCAMTCEFCAVSGRPRCAPVERQMENIRLLVETQGAKKFFVVDDLFGQQRDETLRFCRLLKEYQSSIGKRLWFMVQIRLDKAKDPQLLSAMYDAGVRVVAIGYETPIEEELIAMNKRIRPDEMVSMTRTYHRFGFLVHGMFIFGYPAQDEEKFQMAAAERMKRFKAFIKKSKLDTIQVLLPIPLPGTRLRQRLQTQNRIYETEDVGWEYYDGNFPLFEPDAPMKVEEMQEAIRKIMGMIYQSKNVLLGVLDIFAFPSLLFFLHDLQSGWRGWFHSWRNHWMRFGGWLTVQKWSNQFKKDNFNDKLKRAREHTQARELSKGPL
jgi:radical SAM superfamily enzyme YgiQ (UPF0313 family)